MYLFDLVLPFALLVELASEMAGTLLVVTGVVGGCFRTWAVLAERPAAGIEWMTAFGFAAGSVLTILFVVVDQIWR